MINVSEPIMQRVNLDVKASKCTVLYGRRSGNNWYTGKNDKKPNIVLKKKKKTSRYRKELNHTSIWVS